MTMIHRLSLAAAGPAAVGAALLLAAGCSKPMPAAPAAGAASSETAASSAESRFEIASPDRETWDVFRIQGIRIGYGRTAFGRATQDGRELVKVAGDIHLAVEREGQSAQQAIRFTSTETLQGALVGFESELQMGPSPMRTIGRVRGDRLELEVTSAGKTVTSSMAWSPQYGGPTAPELSLLRQPMKPGEKRTIRSLDISVNHVVETDMTARGVERVELLAGAFDLLRIDTVIHMPGNQTLRGAVWTDRSGETLKSRVDLLNMEVVRATKEAALAKTKSAKFDLWEKSIVKVDRPMERAHDTKRVRYRVHLDEGDPAATFASGPTQSVKRIDEHAAEVTVLAIRPGQTGNPDAADSPPTDADRKSTNFIQSDDERIVADAGRPPATRPIPGGWPRRWNGTSTRPLPARASRRLLPPRPKWPAAAKATVRSTRSTWRRSPAPGHPGPGGGRTGLRAARPGLRLSHVDRNVRGQAMDSARRHLGQGRHRRRASEGGPQQHGRAGGVQQLPAGCTDHRASEDRHSGSRVRTS